MGFNITEIVESPGYKKVMGKVYGWGAAVVILGALWKILHLPGANYMLIAGLGTEAVIFFLSAFEPPHEMPDWSLVYPELVGLEPSVGSSKTRGGGGGSDLAALIEGGHVDEEVIKKLSEGLKKLSNTTSQMSDLSNATLATESFLQNLRGAADTVDKFSSTQAKSNKALEESISKVVSSYEDSASSISTSSGNFASNITEANKNLSSKMEEASSTLFKSYETVGKAITRDVESIADKSSTFNSEIGEINKKLSSINSVYELQLKGINSYVAASDGLTEGIETIKDELNKSVNDAHNYRNELGKLSSTISELNSIYGNMLSAIHTNNK